ncbi:general stress protein [Amaricoccus sp. HAR-UPW-R2A-40]|nr:general stress protein [Amaricoccus sp. HAR-UPW-R2A-40]
MPTNEEITAKFWKALKSDMTVMLGLVGKDQGHTRPMTAQMEGDEGGPIWFFTSTDAELSRAIQGAERAVLTFADKGHDIFACVHGDLRVGNDPEVIDRLWNRHVAAWYEGGKTDPKLVLLRFDPQEAEIWENASSLMAGLRVLVGSDPKEDYKDNVAKVVLT